MCPSVLLSKRAMKIRIGQDFTLEETVMGWWFHGSREKVIPGFFLGTRQHGVFSSPQFQGSHFDLALRLLSVWRFLCSSHVCEGLCQVLWFYPELRLWSKLRFMYSSHTPVGLLRIFQFDPYLGLLSTWSFLFYSLACVNLLQILQFQNCNMWPITRLLIHTDFK